MAFVSNNLRFLKFLAPLGFVLAVAGCQSGDGGSVLGLGLGGGAKKEPSPEQVTAEQLRAYCPRVTLRSGTAFYNTYEKNAEQDPEKIIYQASIADVTRSCNYTGGVLTMTVAAAGKVVPGPVATEGTITMPIRIAVLRGEEVLYSQLHQYPVQIAANAPATQFVFSDPNVIFDAPTARNVQVFVGYDEGPPEKS